MNLYKLYFLFSFIFFKCNHCQPNEDDSCVQDQLKNKPELGGRFDPGLLKVACKKKDTWRNAAVNGQGKAASTAVLTRAQVTWADQVFQCFDLRCLCQMRSQCKQMLWELDSSMDSNQTESDGRKESGGLNETGNWITSRIAEMNSTLADKLRRKRAVHSRAEQFVNQRIGRATRKEIRQLTDEERHRFFSALQALKTDSIDGLSKYDIMIVQHTAEYSPGAHFSASFLPFHREFSKNLEVSLRAVDPTVALHYWDPTLDQGLPDARDSILWSDEFLGNGIGEVTTGPFRNWTTVRDSQFLDLSPNRRIVRNIGASPYGSLYRDSDIRDIFSRNRFRDLVYCVDPFFELVHGGNHLWIGGHMNELRISPNDPVFFLLHSFVDYIWEDWRQSKQEYNQRNRDYVTNSESCNQFAPGQVKMRPYSITNFEGLSNKYTDILYNYESRPTCSQGQPDCGSPYLFCHRGRWKCLSKVKLGGNCLGLENFDPCSNGVCRNGRCRPGDNSNSRNRGNSETEDRPGVQPPQKATTSVSQTADNQDTVWVPITVLSLNGRTAAPYQAAKIVTTDQATGQQLTGLVADPSDVPYYTGSAFAQVKSPFSPGIRGQVRARVEVFDENGRNCAGMCREQQRATYNPCEVTVSLVASSQSSNGAPYAQSVELAKQLNWQGNRHTPDRYLFMCPTGRSRLSPAPAPAPNTQPVQQTTPPAKSSAMTSAEFSVSTKGRNNTDSKDDDITIRIVHTDGPNGTVAPPAPLTPVTVGSPAGPVSQSGSEDGQSSSGQSQDDCRNDHRCCPIWAAVGECKRNPWMATACGQVCGACKTTQPANRKCSDSHPRCSVWAQNGECDSNDLWMEENCKKSCNVCQRSITNLKNLCGASGARSCMDHDQQCSVWANREECVNNPWWMKENCPAACNYCVRRNTL